MNTFHKNIAIGVCIAAGLVLSSCSSSPSDEELKQLEELKAEVASLESKVQMMQRDEAGWEKQIADKNGKLQQCLSDQEAVKKGLGK